MAPGPIFMFCAPGLVFDSTGGVGSRFHVLHARTHFRLYRGRRVPFSYHARPDSFSAVSRASGFFFMFCATGLVFYRGRSIPFSCFARPNSFSAVPRASGPVLMCCTPGSFSAVPRASGSVFMLCAPNSFSALRRVSGPVFVFLAHGLVFGGTEGVGSRLHILRALIRFRQCLVRRVPISCFARPFSFSTVRRALGPVFMFCSPDSFLAVPRTFGPVFMFCAPNSFSAVPRASGPFFMLYAPGLIFGGIEGVGFLFYVLRYRIRFRRYQGRRVSFSCFARPSSFLAIPGASGPVFMFCAPGLIFGATEGVDSYFHVLRSRTHFRRYRGRQVLFSCFALPDSFSTVPRVSGPVFMFCTPELYFGGTEGVGSCFHVLRARNCFWRYRGPRVPFSCFALPESFSAVSRASGSVFMFCPPGLVSTVPMASGPFFMFCTPRPVFGSTEGVKFLFHVLRSQIRFR
jgi:hypothetical protein